jgi:hypothetical protein
VTRRIAYAIAWCACLVWVGFCIVGEKKNATKNRKDQSCCFA